MGKNDKHLVRYAEGTGRNLGKATNRSSSVKAFSDRFRKAVVTSEKMKDYLRLPEADQKALKSVDGWIYRTQVDGPVRNRGSGLPSDMITFDFDYATPEFLQEILSGAIMGEFEWFIHTTRRHTEEKPRFRMFVFVKEPIPNDLYIPVSRIVGQMFDPEMVHVDKVSFRPAQMMFRPTVSRDAEYIFHRNEGLLLNWQKALDEYETKVGDWRDLNNLPKCPGEFLRESAEKAEKPTEKVGPVGDFCRAYDVPAAIAKFLPDKYEPVDMETGKPRYTYLGGTTTNGAEVQDDGDFLYSHHGSDPCGDMLVNSFDLVRIHLFGDEDKDVEITKGMSPAKLPSWRKMIDFIADDPEYRKQVIASRYDQRAMLEDFTDDDVDPDSIDLDQDDLDLIGISAIDAREASKPEIVEVKSGPESSVGTIKLKRKKLPPPDAQWMTKLEMTQDGNIVSNAPNVAMVIQNDYRTRESIEFNEFTQRVVTRKRLKSNLPFVPDFNVSDPVNGDMWEDFHTTAVRVIIESQNGSGKTGYGFKVADRDMEAGIEMVARMNRTHPVREYFNACPAAPRHFAERLFIDYFGCPDTPYYREAAWKWLVAAVARIFEPGHKFDHVPVAFGLQGLGKSTFARILGRNWFGELKADFSDEKKLVEQMVGCLILELPELSSIGRARVEDVKAFVSGVHTTIRLAWHRRERMFQRQCVFFGTTNDETFLIDSTGNRRWWPIKVRVDAVPLDKLAENVDMIWGAAVAIYREMRAAQPTGPLDLSLSAKARQEAEIHQENARIATEADMFAAQIAEWLDSKVAPEGTTDFDDVDNLKHRSWTCIAEVRDLALDLPGRPGGTHEATHIGRALKMNGWKLSTTARRHRKYGVVKPYYPGKEVLDRWAQEEQLRNLSDDDLV